MNESVQKTNIPTIRKPFGADLPPRVPYCLDDNVGSPVCPVYVKGKQIKASDANVGGPTTPIYLKNGVFIAGRSTANLSVETNPEFETEPWIARLVLNPDSPDEYEYVLHAAGGSGSSEFENLNVPLLTPMWFDYVPADTKSWISSDGNFHSGTNADYARIWNHLSAECAGKTNNKSQTFGSITIDYFECADGHRVCICNNATAEGVRTKLNTLVDASHPEIGTAWFYIINTDTKEFYLPRTRYGFHGDLNYVKFAQAGEHAMRLFFHTGNGPGSDNKMDKVTTENGFEADAVSGNVAIYSSREPGQVIDSGHKIVSGVGTPSGTDLVTVDYLKRKADINSPDFTGTPTAPTPTDSSDDSQIATVGYVREHTPVVVDRSTRMYLQHLATQDSSGTYDKKLKTDTCFTDLVIGARYRVYITTYSALVSNDRYIPKTSYVRLFNGNTATSENSIIYKYYSDNDRRNIFEGANFVAQSNILKISTYMVNASHVGNGVMVYISRV